MIPGAGSAAPAAPVRSSAERGYVTPFLILALLVLAVIGAAWLAWLSQETAGLRARGAAEAAALAGIQLLAAPGPPGDAGPAGIATPGGSQAGGEPARRAEAVRSRAASLLRGSRIGTPSRIDVDAGEVRVTVAIGGPFGGQAVAVARAVPAAVVETASPGAATEPGAIDVLPVGLAVSAIDAAAERGEPRWYALGGAQAVPVRLDAASRSAGRAAPSGGGRPLVRVGDALAGGLVTRELMAELRARVGATLVAPLLHGGEVVALGRVRLEEVDGSGGRVRIALAPSAAVPGAHGRAPGFGPPAASRTAPFGLALAYQVESR